ncbi:MAG: hypothetical protein QM766_10475 [Burkholderiaceae bacterium]
MIGQAEAARYTHDHFDTRSRRHALALAALWGFIAPVFVVATDRLMPYLGGEPPVVPARWHDAPPWIVLATGGWALRHGAWFGRPRADGRPG